MFWNNRGAVEDSQPFIVEGDTHYSFVEVFTMADEFLNGVKRGVAIIACRKNLETVVLYCGALRNNLVPLLVDADIAQSLIFELAELYKAEYIFTHQILSSDGYELANAFRSVKMFKRAVVTTEELHKDLALLLPTSGSTGDPKCVRLSVLNITSATESIVRYMGLTSDRISISSLPLHYTYGLSVLNCAMQSRSKFVLTDLSWLDRGFWQLAERESITDLSGVPFMFEVLRKVQLPEAVMNSLKCVNQAGGRLEPKFTSPILYMF
jgi:long-chain acyl-CoA synthetase